MPVLFDHSVEALREMFVIARFAQLDVFGTAIIEDDLRDIERESMPNPDWIAKHFGNAVEEACQKAGIVSALRTCADPASFKIEEVGRYAALGVQQAVSLMVHRAVYLAFQRKNQGAVLLFDVDGPSSQCAYTYESRSLTVAGPEVLPAVLYNTWLQGGPKWKKARQFVVDACRTKVEQERKKAEADFDRAVACSQDGTKIVHADWVVVASDKGTFPNLIRFPASTFQNSKLVRASNLGRITVGTQIDIGSLPAEVVHLHYRHRQHLPQTLLSLDSRIPVKSDRVLLVDARDCPDPLPEGGKQIWRTK